MRNDKGFTLLELMIVLAIIGVAVVLIAPTVTGSLTNLRLKTATKQLSTVLRYARSKAVSSKSIIRVIIDIDNASYSASLPENETGTKEKAVSTAFPSEIKFNQVTVGEGVQTEGLVQLLFYPKGNTSGGEIILENTNGRRYKITIDNLTGKVRINRLSEGED
jgi:general secretion pathway protein H